MSTAERILTDQMVAAIKAYFPRYPTRQAVTLPALHIGLNDWYLAVQKHSTAVLKVRHKVVEEIGIATNKLTKTATDRSVLMHSFY